MERFISTPAVRIRRVRALKKRKYQLPFAIFDVRDLFINETPSPRRRLYIPA